MMGPPHHVDPSPAVAFLRGEPLGPIIAAVNGFCLAAAPS
jgi:hypothetical protein